MSIDEAHLSHVLAGRVRLRIPSRRRDAGFFADVARRLGQCDGVREVRVSPLTASLLILHTTKLDAIAAWASQQKLFTLQACPATFAGQSSAVTRHYRRTVLPDERTRAIRWGRLLSTSLAGLGALQTARGQFMAPALTLFWYAYDARRGLPSIEAASGSKGERS